MHQCNLGFDITYIFSFCKLVEFLRDINRHSTRPDNFVMDVKMFSHVRARAFQSGILYLRGAFYNLLVTSQYSELTAENFITAHCVCLITVPVKYMTLYFNIQCLPRWKSAIWANVGIASINGLTILANLKAKKKDNLTERQEELRCAEIKIDGY